ncbi:mitochondrion biogenesis protein [Phyllosticta citriasiana]|uniref:mitochondrion biogenesis protein n=1 Tax=Phyllosticta citriasiana TaxID=595635 RepID=UPI0030FD81CC
MSRHVAARVGGRTSLSIVDLLRTAQSPCAARPFPQNSPDWAISARSFYSRPFAASSRLQHASRLTFSRPTTTSFEGTGRFPPSPAGWPHKSRQDSWIAQIAAKSWTRSASNTARRRRGVFSRRNKSSVSDGNQPKGNPIQQESQQKLPQNGKVKKTSETAGAGSSKQLLDRLPHLPHRPSKEELLAAANGAWSRFKVHFKWFSIRSGRKFNMDDISAFFSWILLGHLAWVIIGTTTFFSLIIFMVNTVFAQETLARWIGNYLTKSSGIKVVFESAIVPKWGDGVICFKNVFVSRRPGQGQAQVSKGSQEQAAAAAAAAAKERFGEEPTEKDDGNYTQFDVSMDTVNVTLSFTKFFNGKGLLRDVEIKGVRGVVDRTHLKAPEEYIDPRTYKHERNPGDFELDSFKMEDLLVTIYQPNDFRPFPVSIYSCDLPQLRKQWLFYDFLAANNMSGSFDNSLFTIHPRQTHNYSSGQLVSSTDSEGGPNQWKKHSRIRIDALNIDHLNRGVEGPFGWIHEGNVDVVADIMFPTDNDESIAKVMSDFYDRMEATVTAPRNATDSLGHQDSEDQAQKKTLPSTEQALSEDDKRFIVMDIRVQLNDVRAAVPLFTNDISYINNALIRPIVAYINSKRTFIPVNCRVVKRVSEFDGSWSTYDSGLMDDLSKEVYEAFVRDINDDHQTRKRRFKKVGIWTLQLAAQALFIGLAGNIA